MEKNNLRCPFCQKGASETYQTYHEENIFFNMHGKLHPSQADFERRDEIIVQLFNCPNPECQKISIDIIGVGNQFSNRIVHFYPNSLANKYPEYIPETIRNDYEEAYAILNLSPKASATLSRRCLQGMIRDFWQISKNRLVDEIDALKEMVDPSTKLVLDALRKLGNIGAHPEKDINLIVDIEPNEALKLLKFIELLMQKWYIERHENEQLLQDILDLDAEKQHQRKS